MPQTFKRLLFERSRPDPFFSRVRIVLVRPRNPLNIGAAARAMANFGIHDLVVVDPYEPVWRETTSAVGAEALVLKARKVKTIEEAVGDCPLVLGTSAVKNRHLDQPIVPLTELASFIGTFGVREKHSVAILFGSEKTGLTRRHLEQCQACVTIPTDPAVPSMNLSHSVAVCCYELGKRETRHGPHKEHLLAAADRERLIRRILEFFDAAGYLKQMPLSQKKQKIRRSLMRWKLRAGDARIFYGILAYSLKKMRSQADL